MFLNILQSVVFACVVPVMYLIILFFAFMIIRRAPTIELRIRSLVGVLGGILFALAFVIVDVTATGFAELAVDPTNVYIVVPFGVFSAIVGFFVLLGVDVFLRRGAASFVVFFIIWVSLVSAYFLIRASELRAIISLSTVTFLLGNVVYVLMNFNFVKSFFDLANPTENQADNQRWKI